MFAYYSKYKDKDKEHNENVEIWLIYPKHDEINNRCDITQQYIFDNNKQADPQAKLDLQIKFFDFDSDALMEFN
jgi:hypothetical protein